MMKSVGGFGVFPFIVVTRKNENAEAGYLEDESLPGLRKIVTEVTITKKRGISIIRFRSFPFEFECRE